MPPRDVGEGADIHEAAAPEAAEAATAASRRIAAPRRTASEVASSRGHRCLFMPTSCLPVRVLFRPASLRRASPPKPTRCRPAACGCMRIKHDGFRIIARKDGPRVRLYSRPDNDFTRRFQLILETLARLRSRAHS